MNHIQARAGIIDLAPDIATALTEGTRDDLNELREKCVPYVTAIVTHAEEEAAGRNREEQERQAEFEAKQAAHDSVRDAFFLQISTGIHNPSLSAMRKPATAN